MPHRNALGERLRTPAGQARYTLGKQTVEPVFGQIKAARCFRPYLYRGLAAMQAEWALVCTVHNLLKLTKVGLVAWASAFGRATATPNRQVASTGRRGGFAPRHGATTARN